MIFARVGAPASRPVSLIPNVLELHTSHNTGALWGFGRSLPYSSLIFAALSVVAAVAICYWLFVRGAATDGRLTVALGLIMAGALGNCYDRLVFGYVRDFVHFHVDPIGFDLRDLQLRRQHARRRRRPADAASPPSRAPPRRGRDARDLERVAPLGLSRKWRWTDRREPILPRRHPQRVDPAPGASPPGLGSRPEIAPIAESRISLGLPIAKPGVKLR